MYLVEMLLVAILLLIYFAYLNPTGSPRENIEKLAKSYEIYTLCSSLSKNLKNDVNIKDLGITNYLMFNKILKDFSQRIKRLEIVKINYTQPYSCISILYPFPNIENTDFLINRSAYFLIKNHEESLCSFYATRDWILVIINKSLPGNNISLDLYNLVIQGKNITNLDVYSVFSFDSYKNPIKINYIAYDNRFLNISLSPIPIQNPPIFIVFRIKEDKSYPDLTYLREYNNYSNVSYISGIIVQTEKIDVAKWLTIYLNTSCIRNGYVIFEYNIYPSKVLDIKNIQNCYPPDKVIYYKNNLFEYYSIDLEKTGITNRPSSLEYTCNILLNNGLSLTDVEIYGS